jgi:hypothetical protein
LQWFYETVVVLHELLAEDGSIYVHLDWHVGHYAKAIMDAPTTNGADILGWDFAFELNEVAKQQAEAANLNLRFLRIPRDVMDKRAVEQGDIRFFELAALSVEATVTKRDVLL